MRSVARPPPDKNGPETHEPKDFFFFFNSTTTAKLLSVPH